MTDCCTAFEDAYEADLDRLFDAAFGVPEPVPPPDVIYLDSGEGFPPLEGAPTEPFDCPIHHDDCPGGFDCPA